jgi:DNA modification methylase
MKLNKTYQEPCLETLTKMPNDFLDCVITSPPYWQLRDYGYEGQWGLETTYSEYLENLWSMMDEIYRVLKSSGTVWINLGDTYSKSKCLLLIPHRFAIGCIERGWIVRNDIIWAKRNAMPESITDRFSKKHEYFFFMTKSTEYYFDLDGIRDKVKAESLKRYEYAFSGNKGGVDRDMIGYNQGDKSHLIGENSKGKNCGDVADFWDIPTKPNSDKHYASYNEDLIHKPIVSGCPEFVCNKCGKPREKIFEYEEIIVSEKEFSEKYKDSGVNSAGGRATFIVEKLKNNPNSIEIAQFLKRNKGDYTYSMLDEIFGYKDTAAHWFRTDIGFSFPKPSDWIKLKELLSFDDTYDLIMTETVKVICDDKGFKGKFKELSDCGCKAGFSAGIIYDPFIGTGSTAVATLRRKRNFIGSEMSEEYIKICNKRVNAILQAPTLF